MSSAIPPSAATRRALVFETVPQSMLVTYVGTVYGELDPASENFKYLFMFKIMMSLLSAGLSGFSIEVAAREWNFHAGRVGAGSLFGHRALASRYGLGTTLLRGCQLGSGIFWLSLLGCAVKGPAAPGAFMVVMLLWISGCEPAARDGSSKFIMDFAPSFAGGFFASLINGVVSLGGVLPPRSASAPLFWGVAHLMLIGGMAGGFYMVDHVDNNYNNETALAGPLGSPQHYNCFDRTSSIGLAVFFSLMVLVLAFVAPALDPLYGHAGLRGASYRTKRRQRFLTACDTLEGEEQIFATKVADGITLAAFRDILYGKCRGLAKASVDAEAVRLAEVGER